MVFAFGVFRIRRTKLIAEDFLEPLRRHPDSYVQVGIGLRCPIGAAAMHLNIVGYRGDCCTHFARESCKFLLRQPLGRNK